MTLSTLVSLFFIVFGVIAVVIALIYIAEITGLYKPETRTPEQIHHDRMEKLRQQFKQDAEKYNSDTSSTEIKV